MKLSEVIAKAGKNDVLYIGSQSAFFFIGTKEEYEHDMPLIESQFARLYLRNMNSARERFVYLCKNFTDLSAHVVPAKYADLKGCTFDYDEYHNNVMNIIDNQTIKVSTAYDDLRNAMKRFGSQHFPMSEREVISVTRKKLSDEPGYAIQIEGTESGRYWMKKEYDKAMEKRRLYDCEVI